MTPGSILRKKIIVAVGVTALCALFLLLAIYLIGERAKNSYEEIWQRPDYPYSELSDAELKQKILDETALLRKEIGKGYIDKEDEVLMGDLYARINEYSIRTRVGGDAEVDDAYGMLTTFLGNCWANTGLYKECGKEGFYQNIASIPPPQSYTKSSIKDLFPLRGCGQDCKLPPGPLDYFIPKGYRVIKVASGKISEDNLAQRVVLVLEKTVEAEEQSPLLILEESKVMGNYYLLARSDTAMYRSKHDSLKSVDDIYFERTNSSDNKLYISTFDQMGDLSDMKVLYEFDYSDELKTFKLNKVLYDISFFGEKYGGENGQQQGELDISSIPTTTLESFNIDDQDESSQLYELWRTKRMEWFAG